MPTTPPGPWAARIVRPWIALRHRVPLDGLVRGERGGIIGDQLSTLAEHRTPLASNCERVDTGHGDDLEGYTHEGIRLGHECVDRNPVAGARLADGEITVATCLSGMDRSVREGVEVYPLAEALQDQ